MMVFAAALGRAAPVVQETPGPDLDSGSTGAGLTPRVEPGAVSRPRGATVSAPPDATPSPGPLPGGATNALLDDLRQRAGIPSPGAAAASASLRGQPTDATAARGAGADAALELDPDIKEALKQARDWAREALPGMPGGQDSTTLPGRPVPAKQGDRAEVGTNGNGPDTDENAEGPALQRAKLAAIQPEASRRDAQEAVPTHVISDIIRAIRDLILHPVTWLVLTLALLLKLALAMVTVRSRRSLQRRQRARSSLSKTVDADKAMPAPSAGSAALAPVRKRRSSRQGKRQRHQQGQ